MSFTPETTALHLAFAETLPFSDRVDYVTALGRGALKPSDGGYHAYKRTLSTDQQLTDFLRQPTDRQHLQMAHRAALLDKYSDFRASTEPLLNDIRQDYRIFDRSDYLGAGDAATVFTLQHGEEQYALRLMHPEIHSALAVDHRMTATAAVQGEPGFEQIIAASIGRYPLTIANVIPGKSLENFGTDDFTAITDDDLAQLIELADIADERDLVLTRTAGNIMHSPDSGFTLLDFFTSHDYLQVSSRRPDDNLEQVVRALASAGVQTPWDNSPEARVQEAAILEASADVHDRLATIIGSRPLHSGRNWHEEFAQGQARRKRWTAAEIAASAHHSE